MFDVISIRSREVRTVYAVDPCARFLIYRDGEWSWNDSKFYRPLEVGNPNRDKYPDPTAKKVERTLTAEEKEVDALVHMIRQIAGWAGFEIINRIEFRCKKSGRTYR